MSGTHSPVLAGFTAVRRAMHQQVAEEAYRTGMASVFADFSKPVRLRDGSLGYPVRAPRSDDCFAAAIATCLQVPIEQVPDPRLDERLTAGDAVDEINRAAEQELMTWLANRGVRRLLHRTVPVARKRWIGVVPMPGTFNDHCLVMSGGEILFDPVDPRRSGELDGRRLRAFQAGDVKYGFSFRQSNRT
jgi:hypothetical protein